MERPVAAQVSSVLFPTVHPVPLRRAQTDTPIRPKHHLGRTGFAKRLAQKYEERICRPRTPSPAQKLALYDWPAIAWHAEEHNESKATPLFDIRRLRKWSH
ncbi:hypothetical protein NMY22_g13871 [Coprinellus aureogranulatus]|nr:hypothetical protein NMY22_g13871 [Coprinellus aureogranulatus]